MGGSLEIRRHVTGCVTDDTDTDDDATEETVGGSVGGEADRCHAYVHVKKQCRPT